MIWIIFVVIGIAVAVTVVAIILRKYFMNVPVHELSTVSATAIPPIDNPDVITVVDTFTNNNKEIQAVAVVAIEEFDEPSADIKPVESETITDEVIERPNPLSPAYDVISNPDASLSLKHSDGRDHVHLCDDSIFSGSYDSHRVQLCRKKKHLAIMYANNFQGPQIPMVASDGKTYRSIFAEDLFMREKSKDVDETVLSAPPIIFRRTSVDTSKSDELMSEDSLKTDTSGITEVYD